MISQQQTFFAADATKIFLFDEVYPFRAAQEQAEKKKLNAFGMLAKWNPLNRPKEDTVMLSRQELRLEPFWNISAHRAVDYTYQVTYPVPVHNPYAQHVSIDGRVYEIARQGEKGRIDVPVTERCHRKIEYSGFVDGLGRDIKSAALAAYLTKYKFAEFEQLQRPEIVNPEVPLASIVQLAASKLNHEAINAYEIQSDVLRFEKAQMYLRPVFAFEFVWSSADKTGVIEVDGLTGEVIENGTWFKDKLDRLMTRDMLVEIGADVAGTLLPGGGVAIKMIGKMTE